MKTTDFAGIWRSIRVSNRNFVALRDAESNAIAPAIFARFIAHIPYPFAPKLRLKVFFLRINDAEFYSQ